MQLSLTLHAHTDTLFFVFVNSLLSVSWRNFFVARSHLKLISSQLSKNVAQKCICKSENAKWNKIRENRKNSPLNALLTLATLQPAPPLPCLAGWLTTSLRSLSPHLHFILLFSAQKSHCQIELFTLWLQHWRTHVLHRKIRKIRMTKRVKCNFN